MSTLRSHVLHKRASVAAPVEAPQDVLYKAERARQLLDDPILADAFAEIEIAHIEASLSATNDDTRRRAADRANAIRDVRAKLHDLVSEAERKARENVRLP